MLEVGSCSGGASDSSDAFDDARDGFVTAAQPCEPRPAPPRAAPPREVGIVTIAGAGDDKVNGMYVPCGELLGCWVTGDGPRPFIVAEPLIRVKN